MTGNAAKITPQILAREKVCLPELRCDYSHARQAASGSEDVIFAVTWNATQTFDYKGQPKDKDNDR